MAKLYLIRPKDETYDGYDSYLAAIVVANSPDEAVKIYPSGDKDIQYVEVNDVEGFHWIDATKGWYGSEWYLDEWVLPCDIAATYIGEASPEFEAGTVMLSSYHAG